MSINKIFRKFKIGSLIQYSYDPFWWESYVTKRKSDVYGLVISADQTYLYILINCEIVSFDKSEMSKIKVIQGPYSKHV
tara:strand:+ start:4218 stop:4454 length:237 start_codon:yes stop_codon:yes gene_type:complete